MNSNIVIGDADSLIALADKNDANYSKASKVSKWLLAGNYEIIYPNTAILEAITALKRAKNLPHKSHLLNRQYQAGVFMIEFINEEIQSQASKLFDNTISKQNTIFDCIVASTAKVHRTDLIFSFDKWYLKLGFKLAPEK